MVSGAVRYRVVDACKAILAVQDFDDSIVALALGTIADCVRTPEEMSQLRTDVRTALAKEASGWGLKIEQVYITDMDRVKSIRLLQNE